MLGMHRNHTSRRLKALKNGWPMALLLLGAATSGCQQDGMMLSQATPQLRADQKYPILVKPHQETMPVLPTLVGKKLASAEAGKITAFAGNYLRDGHGPLAIIMPGIPNTPYRTGQMQAINNVLTDVGVPASSIEWRIANAGVAAAAPQPPGGASTSGTEPFVFSFTRYVASVERECGDWEKDFTSDRNNQEWSNFGCAAQQNLAAMVADPLDLKRPRATTPIDVDRRTVVIKGYREGTATATERAAGEKGTVSEVAKNE